MTVYGWIFHVCNWSFELPSLVKLMRFRNHLYPMNSSWNRYYIVHISNPPLILFEMATNLKPSIDILNIWSLVSQSKGQHNSNQSMAYGIYTMQCFALLWYASSSYIMCPLVNNFDNWLLKPNYFILWAPFQCFTYIIRHNLLE